VLPEFEVPERFHLRAYELAGKKLKILIGNAVAFPTRTADARADLADQIHELMERAEEALRGKADDEDSRGDIERTLQKRRDEFWQAMDDPFAGYLKPLEPKVLGQLQERMLKQIESLPPLRRGEKRPPAEPHRMPVDALGAGVDTVRQIARAFCPARFAVYDEDDALVNEVHRDWAEQRKKSEAAYLEKAREEKEQE
jgi:hypothetical protein